MKLRFFLYSFLILSLFTILSFFADRYILHRELEAQIDSQLETMAASIIASNLSPELLENFESTDDIIRDALEDQRIDRTIRIFNPLGQLLFSNDMGDYVDSEMSHERWSTITAAGRKLRILTLNTKGYVLEIGVFAAPLMKSISFEQKFIFLLFALILALLTLFSYFVSKYSIRPFERLQASFLILKNKVISEKSFYDSEGNIKIDELRKFTSSKDEIGGLARDLVSLFEHLFEIRRSYQKDLYFLAHELKTPLAKMVTIAENLPTQAPDSSASSQKIRQLCRSMAQYIDDYLQIASIRNQYREKLKIEALDSGEACQKIVESTFSPDKDRLRIISLQSFKVFCERAHLDSILSNLISNALKYSAREVFIKLEPNFLEIIDSGPGLSPEAQSRLGEAFNRSERSDSTGLGLAFVKSICDLYEWKLTYQRLDEMTHFRIDFGE